MKNKFPTYFFTKDCFSKRSHSQIREFARRCVPCGWQIVTEGKMSASYRYFYLQNDGYATFREPTNIQVFNDQCDDYWCVICPSS